MPFPTLLFVVLIPENITAIIKDRSDQCFIHNNCCINCHTFPILFMYFNKLFALIIYSFTSFLYLSKYNSLSMVIPKNFVFSSLNFSSIFLFFKFSSLHFPDLLPYKILYIVFSYALAPILVFLIVFISVPLLLLASYIVLDPFFQHYIVQYHPHIVVFRLYLACSLLCL